MATAATGYPSKSEDLVAGNDHRAAEVIISKRRLSWSLGCGVCLDLGQEAMVRPFAVEFENPDLGLAKDGSPQTLNPEPSEQSRVSDQGFGTCFPQQQEPIPCLARVPESIWTHLENTDMSIG